MRQIIEGNEFPLCVERVGGYRLIDEVMDPIIDALVRNPYAFELVENEFVSFRVVITRSIEGRIPALIIAFRINENKDIVLEWVDEADEAELPD